MARYEEAGDWASQITILNEMMGFYRNSGEREKGLAAVEKGLALVGDHGLSQTVTGGTTCLNAATTMKAFGKAAEAMPYYDQAFRAYGGSLPPGDYRFGGLFNNMALAWEDLGITIWPTMGWWFPELAGVFLAASVIVAVIARMGDEEFMETFINGCKDLLSVAVIIGVARGVSIVMSDARITDTILHFGESLLVNTSSVVFSLCTYVIYLVLSFFVPSSSGLATLSMGIMAPLADFAGVGREIVVIAYAAANSMLALVAPTCGLLMGVLTMTRTSYVTWMKFVGKFLLMIGLLTMVVLAGATILMG